MVNLFFNVEIREDRWAMYHQKLIELHCIKSFSKYIY